MIWAVKNIGLLALGLCILASAASLELRLNSIEQRLDSATKLERELSKLSAAVPYKALAAR